MLVKGDRCRIIGCVDKPYIQPHEVPIGTIVLVKTVCAISAGDRGFAEYNIAGIREDNGKHCYLYSCEVKKITPHELDWRIK